MRHLLLFILVAISTCTQGQFKTDLKKQPTFVFHLTSIDLKTPQDILNTSLGDVISNGRWGTTLDNYTGYGASYIVGLTNHIDFMGSLNGALVWYPFRKPGYELGKKLLLEGDLAVNIKLATERSWLIPYLTVGFGGYRGSNTFGAYAPLGVGVSARLGKNFALYGNFQYRAPVTSEAAHHLVYNFGGGLPLSVIFGKNKVNTNKIYAGTAPPSQPPAAISFKDRDGDGVYDDDDKCPDLAGPIYNGGCPVIDSDGDGIPDSLDKCPNVPGFIRYQGCPLPDRDNDGVADDFDLCPDVFGLQKYQGCPGTDTDMDGDGIPNEIDRCPTEQGPAYNGGCPVLKIDTIPAEKTSPKKEPGKDVKQSGTGTGTAKPPTDTASTVGSPSSNKLRKVVRSESVRNIFFSSNKSDLEELSTFNLEQTLKSLKGNPLWHAQIKAYTDEVEAKSPNNKELAIKRANAVKAYFVGKGIDPSRLDIIDGGIDQFPGFNSPDNSGHRRVEITITE